MNPSLNAFSFADISPSGDDEGHMFFFSAQTFQHAFRLLLLAVRIALRIHHHCELQRLRISVPAVHQKSDRALDHWDTARCPPRRHPTQVGSSGVAPSSWLVELDQFEIRWVHHTPLGWGQRSFGLDAGELVSPWLKEVMMA